MSQSVALQGLPSNADAERFVLGSILLDPQKFEAAHSSLTLEDFSLQKHRVIFQRMADLYDRGDHIDRVTVASELMSRISNMR